MTPDLVDPDSDRVSNEDDELRHYLDDATVLLDDDEALVKRQTADLQEFMLHRRFRYGHHPWRDER